MARREASAQSSAPGAAGADGGLADNRRAAALASRQSGWRTRELLRVAIREQFQGRIALVSSFGADSAVLLHLVAGIDPDLPVIFLDTGKIFAQTHRYRADLVGRFGLTDLRVARPDSARLGRDDPAGTLWQHDPDACCGARKVAPLAHALGEFDAWISGRKRFQGGERSDLPLVEADGDKIKINPLANWTADDIAVYQKLHDLPAHPLVAEGFFSIGCEPCTDRAFGDEGAGYNPRQGRWRGRDRTECGIQLGLDQFAAQGSGI
ncbi:MAG: phosphoadenylyl-sulfate reductase [Alphaproteobacteria bacterium]|nr:MAG: phosphoadenylyl-sulfate reductase [Alphaproteobacteria bacterium]